jgi:hypothetical protein
LTPTPASAAVLPVLARPSPLPPRKRGERSGVGDHAWRRSERRPTLLGRRAHAAGSRLPGGGPSFLPGGTACPREE